MGHRHNEAHPFTSKLQTHITLHDDEGGDDDDDDDDIFVCFNSINDLMAGTLPKVLGIHLSTTGSVRRED